MNATIHPNARIHVEGIWCRTHRGIACTTISLMHGIYRVRLTNGKVASVDYADITLHGGPQSH